MTVTASPTSAPATSPANTPIPGYLTGTWDIDQSHSEVSFSVRHLMVSKVKGRFAQFSGSFVTADNVFDSSVEATVDLASVDTNSPDRDAHLRAPDFLDTDQFPTLTYRSTGLRAHGDGFIVDGELSLHGVKRSVPLALEVNGFLAQSPFGDTRVGFTASTDINRDDFGIEFNAPLEGGGVVVGNKIHITLEIEAIRRADA